MPNGSQWQSPTKVVVVQNPNCRQVDPTSVPASVRQYLQTMTMREAAIRVAQDQANSKFMRQGAGDSRYDLPGCVPEPKDWCGAFVYWCYRRASQIKGQANPLGPDNDVMLSPQKGIGWALANPALATAPRYQGPALYTWNNVTPPPQNTMIDAVPGTNLLPGDVCLLRNETKAVWQHVCMVFDPGGGEAFLTLDGNQGRPSMKMVLRDFSERLGNGNFRFAFLHLNLPWG